MATAHSPSPAWSFKTLVQWTYGTAASVPPDHDENGVVTTATRGAVSNSHFENLLS